MMPRTAPVKPIIAIIGATGTGKSKLAVDLASRFNGEIINGDAMQMYKGMPTITNQIPVPERKGVPHHLIDCIGLDQETWKITRFNREALKAIGDIRSRGKIPILVGGTHYYTQSVLFHKSTLVSEDEREELDDSSASAEHDILNGPTENMLQKLREVDPVIAERWHPNESRKIRRSLQIYLQTGRRASDIYKEREVRMKELRSGSLSSHAGWDEDSQGQGEPDGEVGQIRFPTVTFWTHTEKEALRMRLDKRLDEMVDNGLVQEAQTLFDYLKKKESEGVPVDRTRGIWISIGFKELDPYIAALESKDTSPDELAKLKEECMNLVKTATRQYATHQLKWIRGQIWNAFRHADMIHKLYVLDTTDPGAWDTSVLEPAERVVEAFLSGNTCPRPNDLSKTANEIITARQEAAEKKDQQTIIRRSCELCDITVNTQEQWDSHVKTQRHKRKLKAQAKRAKYEEYKKRLEENSSTKTETRG